MPARKHRPRSSGIPVLEWIAGAIGAMVFAAVLGLTLYQALWGDRSPPDIIVTVESISRVQQGFLIQFRAVNRGGSAAGGVVVEARLSGSDGEERSQTTIDYLAGHSAKLGGLFVTSDPARSRLDLRALGYQKP